MKTPQRKSMDEFLAERLQYRDHRCPRCQSEGLVLWPVSLSIHSEEFGDRCAGEGRVMVFHIPYCPACKEPEPESVGCLHLSEEERGRLSGKSGMSVEVYKRMRRTTWITIVAAIVIVLSAILNVWTSHLAQVAIRRLNQRITLQGQRIDNLERKQMMRSKQHEQVRSDRES